MFTKVSSNGNGNNTAGRDLNATTNINNYYQNSVDYDKIDDGVINEIFKHIEESQTVNQIEEDENSHAGLSEKISLNFFNTDQQEFSEGMKELWKTKNLVEEYIKVLIELNENKVLGLKNKVQMLYRDIKQSSSCRAPIQDIRIIDQMVLKCVPSSKAGDSTCALYARAIIYYFFELCDFGKKTQLEESKIKTL